MRNLAIVLSCCALSACFTAGQRGETEPVAVYDFGASMAKEPAAPHRLQLALEVWAPLWFDGQGIGYRLLYIDSARLREFRTARWAGPVSQLIAQHAAQRLNLSSAGQKQAKCVLRVEISEFSQLFASPESSQGVLRGRLVLLDQARHELAALRLNIEKPAASPDVRGGVEALTAAVNQLSDNLLAWEVQLADENRAGACAG